MLSRLYDQNMKPEHYKKKNLGQVFTPLGLVSKILDHIPEEVMTDPKSTFFDPSAGMGGFLFLLYHRLMKSLSRKIPSRTRRHQHILTNMLFASEITRNNVQKMKKIFGKTMHIHHGDTLKITDLMKTFGVDGFSVIVGNPPFEKPQVSGAIKVGGSTLWIDFVRKSLTDWLKQGGYFGMLLPPGWRKPTSNNSRSSGLWRLMTEECTPIWIKMYDEKQSKSAFDDDVAIRFDLLLLQKYPNSRKNKTHVETTDGVKTMNALLPMSFLPNNNISYWKRIMTNDPREAIGVLNSGVYGTRSPRIQREQSSIFRFPVIHAIHKDGRKVIVYTDEKLQQGGFGVPKLIFNGYGGWNEPFLDLRGHFGMSEVVFGLPVASRSEGLEMQRFFKHPSVLNMFQRDMHTCHKES